MARGREKGERIERFSAAVAEEEKRRGSDFSIRDESLREDTCTSRRASGLARKWNVCRRVWNEIVTTDLSSLIASSVLKFRATIAGLFTVRCLRSRRPVYNALSRGKASERTR